METSKLSHGRWKKLSDSAISRAVRQYRNGKSVAQIASPLGVTRQSIWASLKARGVIFRPLQRRGAENHFYRGGSQAVDAAQNKLEYALRKGRVKRPDACQDCGKRPPTFKDGRTAIQAHHPDYSKPLAVEWLCQPCHHKRHLNA